jgi:hypothetical protein
MLGLRGIINIQIMHCGDERYFYRFDNINILGNKYLLNALNIKIY